MSAPLQKSIYLATKTNYNYVYDKLRTEISNNPSITLNNPYISALPKKLYCKCVESKYRKQAAQVSDSYSNISQNQKIAQIIKINLGGSTQYGNFYLGKPLSINYLGRTEGQPGGGGSPPKNNF
jgi:hypothetical protein